MVFFIFLIVNGSKSNYKFKIYGGKISVLLMTESYITHLFINVAVTPITGISNDGNDVSLLKAELFITASIVSSCHLPDKEA